MVLKIVGGRITEVKAEKKTADGDLKGVDFKINFVGMTRHGGNLTILYTYLADYKDGMGAISVNGELHLNGSEDEAKTLEDTWKKEKKIAESHMDVMVNAVSRTGGQTATLLAYAVDLVSPLILQIPQFKVQNTPTASKAN